MEIKQIKVWTIWNGDRRFGAGAPYPTTEEAGKAALDRAQRSAREFAERARRDPVTLTLREETAYVARGAQYLTREEAERALAAPSAFTSAPVDPRGPNRAGASGFEAWGKRFD